MSEETCGCAWCHDGYPEQCCDRPEPCNWCGSPVRDIGPETTGMESWSGWHVFLCQRPGCGHEMSRKP